MKKFTENFLDEGYRRSLRILRSFALGLIALVWTQSAAFAEVQACDPPTGTVYFMADSIEACYLESNTYTVDILVKDFMNVDSINLFLDYDQTYWQYEGFTILNEETFAKTNETSPTTALVKAYNTPLGVEEPSTGLLNIHWSEWTNERASVGDGVYTPIIQLEFSLLNYPNNTKFPYEGKLMWTDDSKIYYCGGGTSFLEFGDTSDEVVDYTDGLVKVTSPVTYPVYAIYDTAGVTCSDASADVALVTGGIGAEFSVDGSDFDADSTVNAPVGTHTVQYVTAGGCLSSEQTFEVVGPDPVTFDVTITDAGCSGEFGSITFNAEGGSGVYGYFVVPEEDVPSLFASFLADDETEISSYMKASKRVSVEPGNYYVTVQDSSSCVNIYDVSNWDLVTVEDGGSLTSDLLLDNGTVTCPDGSDGAVTLQLYSENYKDGFHIAYNNVDTTVVGSAVPGGYIGTLSVDDLSAGTVVFYIQDSMCSITDTATIDNIDAPTFYIGYTDAPCTEATGSIFVTEVDGSTDLSAAVLAGYTFTVKGADTLVSGVSVEDTIKGLSSGYYEAWLDWRDGCDSVAFENTDGSGNVIPILDDGMINFTTTVTGVTCYVEEGGDGTIAIDSVWRTCESCNEGATYEYMVDGSVTTEWISIDSVLSDLAGGEYTVYVRDPEKTETVCTVSKIVTVTAPTEALQAEVVNYYSPTCPEGNDGYVTVYAWGGSGDYEYSSDERPEWRDNATFAITEGTHTLYIKDANECEISIPVTIDSVRAIEITATADSIECYGSTNPISVTIDSFSTYYPDYTDYTFYYYTASATTPTSFVPEEIGDETVTPFSADTYYVYAQDLNGCMSNIDTVVLAQGPELVASITKVEDATCDGYWDGSVKLEVTSGSPIKGGFQYRRSNNYDAIKNDKAIWNYMDSLMYENLQAGTYYYQITDACEQTTDIITITVEGFDPIALTASSIVVTDAKCAGSADGTITIPEGAATGGAPGGFDGEGGEGASGSYLYTLFYEGGEKSTGYTLIGDSLQTSSSYTGLLAGDYILYVTDEEGCDAASAEITVGEPDAIVVTLDSLAVSCAGVRDGEIYVSIDGGTEPYAITINGITGDDEWSLMLDEGETSTTFQVYGGKYEVVITDANDCSVTDSITVLEPEEWVIDTTPSTKPTDCNEADGVVAVYATGGFEGQDIWYKLDDGYWQLDSVVLDTARYAVDYTVYVANDTTGVTQCIDSTVVSFESPNPFTFDYTTECVKCYGGDDGVLTITNIEGGSGAYQIQLVPSGGTYYESDESLWWPKDNLGANVYTDSIVFDTLTSGTYWIYLRDSEGYTLDKCCKAESAYVCQPDSLVLESVTLVSNVSCAGDSTGALSIQASGGEGEYYYTVTKTDGNSYIGVVADDAVWSTDSIITGLPVGTYVGWVKDANGCITGCEINSQGLPIDDHRVVIQEAGEVTFDTYEVTEPTCYGDVASVTLYGVEGGAGDSLTFKVTGKTYLGVDTTYTYGPVLKETDMTIPGLFASDTTGYVVTLATEYDCESEGDTIHVTQPSVYAVEAVIKADAVCYGDEEVLITIETTGGEGSSTYTIYTDGVAEAPTTNVNHLFNLGSEYVVVATDELGCTATDTLHLEDILPVTFSAENTTCYGDELGSAIIYANGTTGRTFQVLYKEIEGDVATSDWVTVPGWFSDSVEVSNTFTYDNAQSIDFHYAIKVIDSEGCESAIDTLTFDEVQNELMILSVTTGDADGCSTPVTVTATGGSSPLTLYVNGEATEDMAGTLASGTNVLMVMDAHGCFVTDTVEAACVLSIAEVQSSADSSMYIGETVQISGTVSAVADGGFYVQDANAAWSGIYVESTDAVALGDGVTVVGVVDEIDDVTTITDATATVGTATLTVAAVELASPAEVASEEYESVLVVVTGAGTTGVDETTGQFEIFYTSEDSAIVDTTLYSYSADSIIAGHFYNVTGVVDGTDGAYTILPRMESDIVDGTNITETDPEISTEEVEFTMYPNPFDDMIQIDNSDKLTRVIISNIAGQRVMDIEYPSSEIRTANLVSGVYLIRLFTEEGIVKTETMIKR